MPSSPPDSFPENGSLEYLCKAGIACELLVRDDTQPGEDKETKGAQGCPRGWAKGHLLPQGGALAGAGQGHLGHQLGCCAPQVGNASMVKEGTCQAWLQHLESLETLGV